jgi:hypothetical protein
MAVLFASTFAVVAPVTMRTSISFHQRQTVRQSLFVSGCAAMPTSSWSRHFAVAASSGEPVRSSARNCYLTFHAACSVPDKRENAPLSMEALH